MLPQTIFLGGIFHICWLIRKEQRFTIIMKFWKSALCLGNIPLQLLELRIKRGGKNGASRGSHFSLSFWIILNLLRLFGWHELVDGVGWVSLLWALDLVNGWKPFLFLYIFATVDQWVWWVLGLWQISGVLDLVCRGPKKRASTKINRTNNSRRITTHSG